MKKLTHEELDSVTSEDWQKNIGHTLKKEEVWRERDGCNLFKVDPCVVEFGDEATDSERSDGSSDEYEGESAWESGKHSDELKSPRKVLKCLL